MTDLLVVLLIPIVGAVLCVISGRWPLIRDSITLLTAIGLFLRIITLPENLATVTVATIAPGFDLAFHLEPLGWLFACLASFLWIATSLYSFGYMRAHEESNQTRFYAWFALAMASVMGIALSANLLTLFLFYEALTLATWPLVTHHQSVEAKKGGRTYLTWLIGTSMLFLLVAIAMIWLTTGTLEFQKQGVFPEDVDPLTLGIIYTLFLFGTGKAALMPFHRWLPAAMVAPAPVSALLHAVAVVKAGIFTLLKGTVYIFGIDRIQETGIGQALLPVALVTILFASIFALQQNNLKLRLAYSTVSQLAYMVLGVLLASTYGIFAAAMHMIMHGFAKITLFFCAGLFMVCAHRSEVSEMTGVGRVMPLTMTAFAIATIGIIGLPPMGAMWSKWYLLTAVTSQQLWLTAAILGVATLLSMAYLVPIIVKGFTAPAVEVETRDGPEAPLTCLLALGLCVTGCIALFFLAPHILQRLSGVLT